MADVRIFQAVEGGEIECVAGQITLDDTPESAAYLSLFGANEDDSGDDVDKPREWWANKIETDPNKKLRGRLQHLLRSVPLTSGNLRVLEDAGNLDLAWMVETKLATFAGVTTSIPKLNWLKLEVKIEIQGEVFTPAFLAKAGLT